VFRKGGASEYLVPQHSRCLFALSETERERGTYSLFHYDRRKERPDCSLTAMLIDLYFEFSSFTMSYGFHVYFDFSSFTMFYEFHI
jgi:hypothetical protein